MRHVIIIVLAPALALGCALNRGKYSQTDLAPDGSVLAETRYKHTTLSSLGAEQQDGAGALSSTAADGTTTLDVGASVAHQTAQSPTADLVTLGVAALPTLVELAQTFGPYLQDIADALSAWYAIQQQYVEPTP